MTSTTKTISLNDYANDRENVVLFWAGVGALTGDYAPLGDPDFDFADRRGLLDLIGTVDADGTWRWDGEGDVSDDRANTIYKVESYVDAVKWAELTESAQ